MIEPSEIEARIRTGVEGVEHVVVRDLTGTKDHFAATVVAAAFEGKSRVAQHQLVYRALGELVGGAVHALALETHTPASWAERA
ncbi:MAG: BolA/IbaG family iron-sulfur metabolism protein [Myxococcales bacterium]|nr:BolA/IbaG family iron-sulfur metabolism protein [Myxococcales bacterium]